MAGRRFSAKLAAAADLYSIGKRGEIIEEEEEEPGDPGSAKATPREGERSDEDEEDEEEELEGAQEEGEEEEPPWGVKVNRSDDPTDKDTPTAIEKWPPQGEKVLQVLALQLWRCVAPLRPCHSHALQAVLQIFAGAQHSMALVQEVKKDTHRVYVWGQNTEGQLGLGGTRNRYTAQWAVCVCVAYTSAHATASTIAQFSTDRPVVTAGAEELLWQAQAQGD